MTRMRKLYDACDDYLTDPKNPDKYTLLPYAHELEVLYTTEEEVDTGTNTYMRTIKHREDLSVLLDRAMEKPGGEVLQVKYKQADPRRLIIDTANTLTRQLEVISKIRGLIHEGVNINITNIQQWNEIKAVILDETKDYPEIRERIARGLTKLTG